MPTVPDPESARATGANAFRVIDGDGIDEKPELPEIWLDVEEEEIDDRGNKITVKVSRQVVWHKEVQRAWDVIWESPLRKEFIDVDLVGMHAGMLLLNGYYENPRAAYLTEFRMWCNEFGLTPSARRKMRITIAPKAVPKTKDTKKTKKRSDPRLRK